MADERREQVDQMPLFDKPKRPLEETTEWKREGSIEIPVAPLPMYVGLTRDEKDHCIYIGVERFNRNPYRGDNFYGNEPDKIIENEIQSTSGEGCVQKIFGQEVDPKLLPGGDGGYGDVQVAGKNIGVKTRRHYYVTSYYGVKEGYMFLDDFGILLCPAKEQKLWHPKEVCLYKIFGYFTREIWNKYAAPIPREKSPFHKCIGVWDFRMRDIRLLPRMLKEGSAE